MSAASYFGDSYCRIDAVQDLSSFQVSLQFKTSRRSGLLLLAAGHRDYLSLELYNGRLQVRRTAVTHREMVVGSNHQVRTIAITQTGQKELISGSIKKPH